MLRKLIYLAMGGGLVLACAAVLLTNFWSDVVTAFLLIAAQWLVIAVIGLAVVGLIAEFWNVARARRPS